MTPSDIADVLEQRGRRMHWEATRAGMVAAKRIHGQAEQWLEAAALVRGMGADAHTGTQETT